MSEYSDKLEYALNIMHDQSKYAETKNASLIVFTGALWVGILSSLDKIKSLLIFDNSPLSFSDTVFNIFILILSFVFLTSICCSLISFFPKINQKDLDIQNTNNILLFSSNASIKNCMLLNKAYKSRYKNENNYNIDLSNQILNLSRIAARKYKWFKRSLYCLTIGLVSDLIVCFFLYFILGV